MGGRGWSWAGAVALVLALCVGIGWAVALIVVAVNDEPIGPRTATFLATIGGALAGAVVGWLGASTRAGRGRHRAPRDPSEDGA
jgi:hypothetical protein